MIKLSFDSKNLCKNTDRLVFCKAGIIEFIVQNKFDYNRYCETLEKVFGSGRHEIKVDQNLYTQVGMLDGYYIELFLELDDEQLKSFNSFIKYLTVYFKIDF